MRPERLYLTDIIEAADSIHGFLEDVDQARFMESDLLRSAVLQKLTTIGEAVSHLLRASAIVIPRSPGATSPTSATSPFMPTSRSNGPSSGSPRRRKLPCSARRSPKFSIASFPPEIPRSDLPTRTVEA